MYLSDLEELWDPSYFNQTVWVDLDKKPLHKYLYYPALYEGELIYVPCNTYPQEDSFAFLKTMKEPSRSHWLLAILFCVFATLFCLAVGFYMFYRS